MREDPFLKISLNYELFDIIKKYSESLGGLVYPGPS